MLTDSGITFSGTTNCEFPGCPNTIIRQRVTDKYCVMHRGKHTLEYIRRLGHDVEFIMVDGEGSGEGPDHKYVLLGVGDVQLERPDGFTDITEIFGFLYEQFKEHPDASFCGFYLGYDYNMWLRLLPRDRAFYLLTEAGRRKRKRVCKCARADRCKHSRIAPHPVEFRGWQFDILGYKRLRIRPKVCECQQATCKCPGQAQWMYINDSGPFFQASLISVIDPKKWETPIVTDEEFATILEGKSHRGAAVLDDDMRRYNRLENEVGARLLTQLNLGFTAADIRLNKKQWFGPGQAAQAWMRIDNKLNVTTNAVRDLPRNLKVDIIATYYGGWFEIPCHGIVAGITYEYDINSAYPSIASRMPCMCGKWTSGNGSPRGNLSHKWLYSKNASSPIRLCYVTVTGKSPYLGPLPYRDTKGGVSRPRHTEGWYWQHELDAAKRAGLITDITYHRWHEYHPCAHAAPLRALAGLYEGRQRIGKDTPQGKAYKLVYNSCYGKLAQSLGDPVFANPVYASLITSGCRTLILHAIATHPDKAAAVVMVATDGVYFLAPHPGLDASLTDEMGDWSKAEKHDLTLFKPGVYWDDHSRELINAGKTPRFKARGINAQDFARSIADVDAMFDGWSEDQAPNVAWPTVEFKSRFSQVSVLQALRWTDGIKQAGKQEGKYRALAGQVSTGKTLTQSSEPDIKRNPRSLRYDPTWGVWRTEPWDHKGWPASTPYERRFGVDLEMNAWDEYSTPDGSVMMGFREALYAG
jgi:DNA polymerase type B, organellar and viral